ncbi:MAG: hypothetical protein ACOCX2_12975, partial [Armatimonadota bacterium]
MSETSNAGVETPAENTGASGGYDGWSNRRIIFLAIVIALIFYAVFRLPIALNYVLARARETLILLILSVGLAYFLLPAVEALCRININLRPEVKRAVVAGTVIFVFLLLLVLLVTVTIAPIVEETGQVLQTVTDWAR